MDNKLNKNYNCLLHNQPEGILIAVPIKNGGMAKINRHIFFSFKKLNNEYNRNSATNQFKFILKKQNKSHIKESYFDKTK